MRMKLERWYPLGFPGGAECAWTAAGLGSPPPFSGLCPRCMSLARVVCAFSYPAR